MAPMEFQKLVESQVTDQSVKTEIQNLLTRKITGEELNEEPKNQILDDFLERKIEFYNDYIKTIQQPNPPNSANLNELFRFTINEVWKTKETVERNRKSCTENGESIFR